MLVHVGFALSRIDEEQARETIELLEQMGEAYEQEVREIRESAAHEARARALPHLLRRGGRRARRRRGGPNATVEVEGDRERVGIELVQPVEPGDSAPLPRGNRAGEARLVKCVDEFRDGELAQKLAREIEGLAEPGREVKLMEVCGGHTHAIYKHGVESSSPTRSTSCTGPAVPSASSRWAASTTRSPSPSGRR